MKGHMGAGLSLERFAKAKVTQYDKRKVIADQLVLKAKRFKKYKKVKQRLEKEGVDKAAAVTDLPDLDDIFGTKVPAADTAAASEEPPSTSGRAGPEDATAAHHKRRKHQQHLQQGQGAVPGVHMSGAADAAAEAVAVPSGKHKHKRPKPLSQLQRLAQRQQQEKQERQQQQEEKQKAAEEHKRQLQQSQRHRQQQKHKFFQKTRKGQPVIKHRMEKILEQLQKEKAGGGH